MNNNVGSIEVGAATKHKDPQSLLGYIRKDDGSLGAAALGVSNAVKKRGRDFSIAGVEFDSDEETVENNQSSNSLIANNNENTKKVSYSDGKNQINLTFNMNEYHYDKNKPASQHQLNSYTLNDTIIYITIDKLGQIHT